MSMTSFWCLYVNSDNVSHIAVVFELVTLNKQMPDRFDAKLITMA